MAAVSENKDEKETEQSLNKAVEEKTDLLVEVERLKNEVDEWKEKFDNENKEKEPADDAR